MSNEELLKKKYLESLSFKPFLKKLFLVGFVGLPGSGKTFVSNILSDKTKLPFVANDHIRRFLEKEIELDESSQQKLVQKIAMGRTDLLYENHISHIIDADLYLFIDLAITKIGKYGGELLLVKIESPEEVAIQNIENREVSEKNFSKAGVKKYSERKELYKIENKQNNYYFSILNNGTKDVEKEVQKLVDKLEADGYLDS